MRTRLTLIPALLVLALGSAACGGDDDTAAEPGGSPEPGTAETTIEEAETTIEEAEATVEVLAEDIGFPEDTYETEAGTVNFVYENVGNILHTLVIEDVDGLDLTVNSKGDVDEGAIELEPGTYTLFCDVPGHRPAGMVADLVVT